MGNQTGIPDRHAEAGLDRLELGDLRVLAADGPVGRSAG